MNGGLGKVTEKKLYGAPRGFVSGRESQVCTDEMFGSPALSAEKVAGILNEISHVFHPLRSSCNITEGRKFSQSESTSISVYWRMPRSAN